MRIEKMEEAKQLHEEEHKLNILNNTLYALSGDTMNINLGAPYEAKLQKIVKRGYAGNQTEALRQAITRYEQDLEDEEAELLRIACERDIEQMHKDGRTKLYTLDEIRKKYKV